MSKEKWIDDVLGSAKKIQPVNAGSSLATRVKIEVQKPFLPGQVFPLRWVYSSAAVLVLLLVLNLGIWAKGAPHQNRDGLEQLIHEYGWDNSRDWYSSSLNTKDHE